MPKRAMVATFLTTAALALLLSFKTPQAVGVSNAGGGANVPGAYGTSAAGGTAGTGGAAGNRATYSGQLTGQAVQTPFGTVQVRVTLQSGKITDVQALQMPSGGGHTGQITAYAAPQLRSETLQAQSAQIDTISGATYTSEGYIQSLQSALDQAA